MLMFNQHTTSEDIKIYFNKLIDQYGSIQRFCKTNNLEPKFYHRMTRADKGKVTSAALKTLNESFNFYQAEYKINVQIKELATELHLLIKQKYNSVFHMCKSNNMMEDYQRIVGYCNGRRNKIPRSLMLKIRKISSI